MSKEEMAAITGALNVLNVRAIIETSKPEFNIRHAHDYNDAVQRVPDLAVARAFAFAGGEFYQAEAGQRAGVVVKMP